MHSYVDQVFIQSYVLNHLPTLLFPFCIPHAPLLDHCKNFGLTPDKPEQTLLQEGCSSMGKTNKQTSLHCSVPDFTFRVDVQVVVDRQWYQKTAHRGRRYTHCTVKSLTSNSRMKKRKKKRKRNATEEDT